MPNKGCPDKVEVRRVMTTAQLQMRVGSVVNIAKQPSDQLDVRSHAKLFLSPEHGFDGDLSKKGRVTFKKIPGALHCLCKLQMAPFVWLFDA